MVCYKLPTARRVAEADRLPGFEFTALMYLMLIITGRSLLSFRSYI